VARRSRFGTLTLLGVLLALPGIVRAQGNAAPPAGVPAQAPPGLDAVAVPLNADAAGTPDHPVIVRKVIASSQPGLPLSFAEVPVPDDGLTPGTNPTRHRQAVPITPSSAVRTAVYRPDVDAGPIQLVDGSDGRANPAGSPGASRTMSGARLEMNVEGATELASGKPFVYTIRVQSTGTAPAAAVRVTDQLQPGIRLLSAEPKPEVAGDRLAWNLGDLPPGTERRVKVTIDADRLTAALVVNPIASFGFFSGLRVTPARPALELRLAGPEMALPGVAVPYRVQVVNNGTMPLPRVLVTVKLSPGLRHPQLGRGDAMEAEIALGPGETKTLPLDMVASGVAGPNVIIATARTDAGLTIEAHSGVNIDANASVAPVGLRTTPRLRVEINNLNEAVPVGTTAVYEVKVVNGDDVAQTGIRLMAELSEGLEPEQADGPTASVLTPHGVVFETLRRLGPGEFAVYHVRAHTQRAGVQRLRVEVNADHLAQPPFAEASTWVAPGRGR
jgi:uncharacterized repeat protein (TIGR01451 family)